MQDKMSTDIFCHILDQIFEWIVFLVTSEHLFYMDIIVVYRVIILGNFFLLLTARKDQNKM